MLVGVEPAPRSDRRNHMNLVLVQQGGSVYAGNKELQMQAHSVESSSNVLRRFGYAVAGSGIVFAVRVRYAWVSHAVNMSDVDVFAATVAAGAADGVVAVAVAAGEVAAVDDDEQKQGTVVGRQLVAVERIVE